MFYTECSCSIVEMERVCMWWEHFSSESKAFSLWINEKEKELEAVSSTSSLEFLDKHINTVEVRSISHSSHIFHMPVIFFFSVVMNGHCTGFTYNI